MRRFFDHKRLLLALPLIAALLGGFFLLSGSADDAEAIERARLLPNKETAAGRSTGLKGGDIAPDFEISTADGRRVRLSELRGRPVLVNFWATWCGSCLSEMPEIKALQEEKGREVFNVLAVNAGESLTTALKFIDFLQAPFLYGLDPGLVVSDAYGVYGLPLSVFIDSQGIVQSTYNGHASRPRLEAYVRSAIEASPPGNFPDSLRMVSTVPRERVLQVTKRSNDSLELTSPALRCDPQYCADDAITSFRATPGVKTAKLETIKGLPSLKVRFEPSQTGEAQLISALKTSIEALNDPVYRQPIEVR